MMTLTMLPSKPPSADTFMEPDRPRPAVPFLQRLAAAPTLLLHHHGVAGEMCRRRRWRGNGRRFLEALPDRHSRAGAHRPARPTRLPPSCFRTTLSTGATSVTVPPPPLDGFSRARASCSCVWPSRPRNGRPHRLRSLQCRLRRPRACRRRPRHSSATRSQLVRGGLGARQRRPHARSRSAGPAPPPHGPPPRRSAPPSDRGLISGAAAGVSRQDDGFVANGTVSPGSSSMRCTRPITGAETTIRCARAFLPRLEVTCIGRARPGTASTPIARGHSAAARISDDPDGEEPWVPSIRMTTSRWTWPPDLLPHLQHRHEIEAVQAAAAPPATLRHDSRSNDAARHAHATACLDT